MILPTNSNSSKHWDLFIILPTNSNSSKHWDLFIREKKFYQKTQTILKVGIHHFTTITVINIEIYHFTNKHSYKH